MTEVDAPLRSPPARAHRRGRRRDRPGIRVLCGLSGPGGSPPGPRWPGFVGTWSRASAVYINTVGRGLQQIRQEARLRDALEDYLDQGDWDGRAPEDVRRELQAYVAGRADLAWAMKRPAPPSLRFRVREAAHEVGVPLLLCRCFRRSLSSCRRGPSCCACPNCGNGRLPSGRRSSTWTNWPATRTS